MVPTLSKKATFTLLLIVALTVVLAVIPEVIGEDAKLWCQQTLGENYAAILAGILIAGTFIVVFLTTDLGKARAQGKQAERFNIPVSAASRELLKNAKIAIAEAEPEQALKHLADLKLPLWMPTFPPLMPACLRTSAPKYKASYPPKRKAAASTASTGTSSHSSLRWKKNSPPGRRITKSLKPG